ncbi:MAG: phenylalanine--tRNA ligase subunit alpha [Candidatus Woykebacteria bacterium RBG_13_40_15]|uniref:Phenylalanine--tRNA ligase alpha subunit n=1 Tax=Candidatus Woykebacteria bacterium RBG_13_40_15 TaxID=1802593 RepID=A0A1G1W746_9BACT|nr:MAG: phenylalanine--tRNA ligase subunit alpha [Candidatus Woykebacteria bacterium RBG_13_40_15]
MVLDLNEIERLALKELSQAKTGAALEKIRIKYFGRRRGILQNVTKQIPKLPKEQKAGIGTKINKLRTKLEQLLNQQAKPVSIKKESSVDLTTPGKEIDLGGTHPLTSVIDEVKEIFHSLGFSWIDGPEVELDAYNFQKLNMPQNHPARDVQQTYYINDELLLRTHTSSMQVRYMEDHKPPIRVLFPGRCYRRDMPDSTHLPSFYQIEGLLIDDASKMSDLIGTLDYFAKSFFGKNLKTRVYGHHFAYTEPSIEMEVYYPGKGWLEILGAGMVNPIVLKNGRIDPNKFRGWAFGMGPDRLALLKYGISDIRSLYNSDLRFLKQF